MISGFLLLNPQKEIGLDKIRRYLLRMIAVLASFGLFYCLIETAASEGISNPAGMILVSIKNLFEGKSWSHMWYVYMLIGLYLLTPLLRIFVREADDRTACVTLAALFAFTILRPTLNALFKLELDEILAVTAPYPFYYLAGYYLGRMRISGKVRALALLTGLAGIIAMLILEMRGYIEMPTNTNAFIALYSMAVFATAKDSQLMLRISGHSMIRALSKYSFGIYLTHDFFLNLFYKGFQTCPDILPTGIGELAFFALALSGSYALTWVLCKIKPLCKMLL